MRHITEVSAALDAMCAAARSFYDRGWMLGTSGNLSVATGADPLRFHVTRSGMNKGALTRDDFVACDDQARPLEEGAPRPSDETHIHAEIYRRTDAGAVYHVHQVHAALCSTRYEAQGYVPLARLEMLKGIGLPSTSDDVRLPIVPNHIDIPHLAEVIGQVLDPGLPGVLIARHGIYTWGKTPRDAFRHIEIWGYLLEYAVLS